MSNLPRVGRRNIASNNESNRIGDILGQKQEQARGGGYQGNSEFTRGSSQDELSGNLNQQYSPPEQEPPKLAPQFREQFNDFGRGGPVRPSSNTLRAAPQLPPLEGAIAQRGLSPSMSAQALPVPGMTASQGRAMLADLDRKFDEQDRMIKFLQNQINQSEDLNQVKNDQSSQARDNDMSQISKIQNELQFNSETQKFQQQEITAKLKSLEDQVLLADRTRTDLRDKLRVTEDNNREMINFIKNLQSQGDQELSSMRNFLQNKISEDQTTGSKLNEKNTVLFNEMVRLGQENEKYAERVNNMSQAFEQQINGLTQRIASSEQNGALFDRKGENNTTIMAEFVEKLENKILNMEQRYNGLSNEMLREQQKVGGLEISNLKNSEEFKNVIGQIQVDFGGRLELKMTDLVNRLLLEQEERNRQIEDVKYQIDIKDKMVTEKSKYEREEMRDRYSAMDSVVKAEFQRKDESIMGLQQSMENQLRTINGWIKQEELARNQQEINLRTEIAKAQDNVRYDVDNFKGQQVQVTEKLSEMIKMEVDSRLQTDKESKNLYQGLIRNVMQEVAQSREGQESTILKLVKDVKDTAQDSAERAHFLSRYIDEEVLKIGQKATKQIDNIKVLSAKLTEQFKKHLINHENMKKDIYKRFEIIEGHLPVYRSELYKLLESNESRAMTKIKEIKEAVEQTMLTNFQVLDERVDKFSELVDTNLETLRKAIADNRDVYVNVINKSNLENEERMNSFVDDLENVVNELYEIQSKIDSGQVGGGAGASGGAATEGISKQLNDLEAHLNTSIITEKSVRKAQDKYLAEEIDKFARQMAVIQDKVKVQLDEDGNVTSNKSKTDTTLKSHDETINQLLEIVETLKIEVNDINEKLEKGIIGGGSKGSPEETLDVMTKLNERLDELEEAQKKLAPKKGVRDSADDYIEYATLDQVDGKLLGLQEKLRGDNQAIWKETVELAQKQFSEKGIQETMDFMPGVLQGAGQLKGTVNILDAAYEGDTQKDQPRPQINK